MAYLTSIIVWIAGVVCGWLMNELMDSLKLRHKKRVRIKNNIKLLESLATKDYTQSKDGHILLEHAAPFYSPEQIKGSIVDKNFFYPIPEKYRKDLRNLGFTQDNCDDFQYIEKFNCLSEDFWGKEAFDNGLSVIGNGEFRWDDSTKRFFSDYAEKVAELFLSELREGKTRFNGLLFGIALFSPNRSNGVEYPTMTLEFYKSDYFTFRLFSQFYQDNPIKCKINNKIINKLCYPFLCSFGVDILAVISTNNSEAALEDSDILVIGRRSKTVISHQCCLHFTMNEALSIRDTDINTPSFEICAARGFNEELKWTSKARGLKFGDFRFMDFTLNRNGEMAIFGYVKLGIINNMPIEEVTELLNKLYLESQDGILETEGLEFVPIKDARSYLNINRNKMSVGFSEGLECFLRRYELGII